MAEQNPGEAASTEAEQRTGRHAAPEDDPGATAQTTSTGASSSEPTQQAEAPTQQAEAPTQQAETPTHVVEQPGSDEATRVSPVPQERPTQRMDGPQGPPPAPPASGDRGDRGDGARRAVRRVTGVLATVLRIVGLLLALVLVAYVVLTLTGVNPENGAAQLVAQGADLLVMRFRDLFLPADPRLALVVGYGLAALFWLVVGLLAARVVRALGRLV